MPHDLPHRLGLKIYFPIAGLLDRVLPWTVNRPSQRVITWGDGSPATIDDYRRHQLDTHARRIDPNGYIEVRFFPDIVGEVVFDRHAEDWIVRGDGIPTTPLEICDPFATDERIVSELYTFPTVFKARIVRTTTV